MFVYCKIAYRNVLENRKRTRLIGITLLLSCLLLLFSFTLGNGIEEQILGQYRNFLSGDISVVWENVKEYDVSDPSRLHFSEFDLKKDLENKEAITILDSWLEEREPDILEVYKALRGNGVLDTGRYASYSIIVGLDDREADFYVSRGVLNLLQGSLPFRSKYGICISDVAAKENHIQLGDWVVLDSNTASGYVNSLEYQVVGFYKSNSDFDSIYVYMTDTDFLELYDQPEEYFHSVRIYLKNPEMADALAVDLAQFLQTGNSGVLRAESINESGEFYLMISGFLKSLFTLFVVFILSIIAVGIRSVVRMNLFERMKEFGTLRAIGFNRVQSFFIIFLEIFILAMIFFVLALGISCILVYFFSQTGIPVGAGAFAYILGGERIYPKFIPSDTLTALLIITCFSLLAPVKPALVLLYQNITNMLSQNQKRISVIGGILHSLFGARQKKLST
ncbi:MAG: ABC transporter permease [Clostridiaceae bacterium]|nr:ABC transporter permease [Clostridiaceae bacterium]